jgi:hypothetical protein
MKPQLFLGSLAIILAFKNYIKDSMFLPDLALCFSFNRCQFIKSCPGVIIGIYILLCPFCPFQVEQEDKKTKRTEKTSFSKRREIVVL